MRRIWLVVRKVVGFELHGFVSLGFWVLRRRQGVPRGATAVPYSREQMTILLVMLFVMVVETVAVDLLLNAIDCPMWLRGPVLLLDVYGILFGVLFGAASATRPHVVSADELRLRYGAYFDLRVGREMIADVRLARDYNAPGMVRVADGRLTLAVSSQTNLVVDLTEPVTVVRPLGRRAEVTTLRFFADDPAAALRALRSGPSGPAGPAGVTTEKAEKPIARSGSGG